MFEGTPLAARPVTVIQDVDDVVALHLVPGAECVGLNPTFDPNERLSNIELFADGRLEFIPHTWLWNHVLMLMRPGDAYSPMAFIPEHGGRLGAWYINLQEPFRRTSIGFDTLDHILDIVVAPDLSSWHWKDENEAERVLELGLATPELVQQVRSTGEGVIEMIERGEAWWSDWASWVPDASTPVPSLPDGWQHEPTTRV